MSLNFVFVIFPNQRLYPQFLISLAITRKKIPTATNVWWIPKIYTWNFVVNCLYPNNNGMLSTRGTTCLITWHKCKGFRFSAPGRFNSKLQQKMQTQWCPISNVQSLKKGRDMPTVRIMLTSTNGRFRKLCKISKTAGEWGQRLVQNSPISLIHLIHEADLKY